MRRIISLLFGVLLGCLDLSAQTTAQEWVAGLNASLGSRYAYNIAVTTADGSISGYYMVEGDGYYLTLGVMEVYSDGKLRYEINNERKEVTEDRVNLKAVDLLTNPTRAFSFIDKEFTVTIAQRLTQGVVLKLVPRDTSLGISHILLSLSSVSGGVVPTKIVYNYDGDSVDIALSALAVSDKTLPRWNSETYRAYDIVSFL